MSDTTPSPNQPETVVQRIYTNPLHPGYLADPFAWEYAGEYYAVGTGAVEASGQEDDMGQAASNFLTHLRLFPLLRSDDFVTWHEIGHALLPPDPSLGDTFWAPEVAYHEGTFYLYYSVGFEDKNHQLRVATSTHPQGPYADIGQTLWQPQDLPFAIDPHPFQDEDGQWYLFYARDFLDTEGGARVGTALVVDRLLDMTTLAGEPQTVMRAHHDWQLFQKDREMYGRRWDWYTLEGPCVRKHEGRYYCFYSGGRWETEHYGVDYCVADNVLGPYEDTGNDAGPRVLGPVPDHVRGPGHISILIGPDRQTPYLFYHAWDPGMTTRHMCMDKLIWTPEGPRCDGPTWTPQTITAVLTQQDRL
ncbi:MAG TPA: glycoside hydrolase family 43 protein [Chthonomonadaceae bacterium]|nr:glycoside hydrolase family 43 protein [Chthonomonadaceae bacterium]